MQAALGELTFESEAADRLRGELRSANRQVAQLQQQLQDSARQLQVTEEAAAEARQLASDASHGSEEQQRAEKQLQVELLVPQLQALPRVVKWATAVAIVRLLWDWIIVITVMMSCNSL